jgi:predicted  nucleic acid-binding Zn-ribbon protein
VGQVSDTPETDALREAIDNGRAAEAEMTSLAGKLEEKIERLEKQIRGLNDYANERYEEIQRVRRERDEARNAFAIATDQCVLAQAKLRKL